MGVGNDHCPYEIVNFAAHILAYCSKYMKFPIALLVAGSAISLISLAGCSGTPKDTETNDEAIISRTVHDMEMLSSENGQKTQLMRASLVEEHAFARPAFAEYPRGVEAIGYDSLGQNAASRVIADYALHWTERDLWELKGNVLVEGESGEKLYTQQLFWDRKIKKIYSNVDSRVENGTDVLYITGFEAIDDLSQWTSRGLTGTVGFDVEPTEDEPVADSTAVSGDPGPVPEPSPDLDPAAVSAPASAPVPLPVDPLTVGQ
jgi:hypothetical protein